MTMELKREHFRTMILYDFKSGLHQQESVDRLAVAYGEKASQRASVFRCLASSDVAERLLKTMLEANVRLMRPQKNKLT